MAMIFLNFLSLKFKGQRLGINDVINISTWNVRGNLRLKEELMKLIRNRKVNITV